MRNRVKKTWSTIINVLRNFEITSKFLNNNTYNEERFTPQIFKQYSTLKLAKKIQDTMTDTPADKGFSDYLNNISMPNSFYFSPVSSQQF